MAASKEIKIENLDSSPVLQPQEVSEEQIEELKEGEKKQRLRMIDDHQQLARSGAFDSPIVSEYSRGDSAYLMDSNHVVFEDSDGENESQKSG